MSNKLTDAEIEYLAKGIIMGGGPDEPDPGVRVKCLHCGDVIQSMYRHDYKWCSCHSVAIDGGGAYTKMSYEKNAKYIFVESDKDLDATLVGPRDTSEDGTWCHNCEQWVLRSDTERREVEIEFFNTTKIVERDFCKQGCQKKGA